MAIFLMTNSSFSYANDNPSPLVTISSDTTKEKKSDANSSVKERTLSIRYLQLPSASQNFSRFKLISDYTLNEADFHYNRDIQEFISADPNYRNDVSIGEQVNYMNSLAQSPLSNQQPDGFSNSLAPSPMRDAYYGTLRANLVNITTESELDDLISQSTTEMMNSNMGDLSNDLLPFITMLMDEHHVFFYDANRAQLKPQAKGIVTAVEMLNTMGTLDRTNKLGVCRDTHDMGLRVLRNMYRAYLDKTYPGNNYNVDDYIFLQAWVTPKSQHVTLVVIDPENTRDFHELDWGRVIKKTDQEGVEIGKMVGTAIRLYQFDEKENISAAINLVRSQWGALFDKELFDQNEQWQINGIYSPQYSSEINYRSEIGNGGKLSISAGAMAAQERYLSSTIRSGKHQANITRLLNYDGFGSFQSMYVDDTYRKTNTMMWGNWENSSNVISSARYVAGLKSKKLNITPNLTFHLFAKSQLEAFFTMSNIESDEPEFETGFYTSGDANMWTTWGSELDYQSDSKGFSASLNYIDRRFLIPKDVRLLSPNPGVFLENLTAVRSGQGIQLKGAFHFPKSNIVFDTRFEKDAMKSKFIYGAIEYNAEASKNLQFFTKSGYFQQVDGIEYYWYAKGRLWVNSGVNLLEQKTSFSLFSERIDGGDFSIGVALSKSF
ncbi:MAG: hypothetical protein WAU36_00955 [Cyclobacteriaceae bacterium]